MTATAWEAQYLPLRHRRAVVRTQGNHVEFTVGLGLAQAGLVGGVMPLLDIGYIMSQIQTVRVSSGLLRAPYCINTVLKVHFPGVLILGDDLPRGVFEIVEAGENPKLYYERSLPIGLRRVSIAHGVAHLLWDMGTRRISCSTRNSVRAREQRADLFASELLLPLVELDALVTNLRPRNDNERQDLADHIDIIAEKYVVPASLVKLRLRALAALRRTELYVP